MKTFTVHAVDRNGYSINYKRGTFKELGGARTERCGDSTYTRIRIVAPRHFTPAEVEATIYATYHYRCGHSHDCCGCVMSSAYDIARTRKRREYSFALCESRNI